MTQGDLPQFTGDVPDEEAADLAEAVDLVTREMDAEVIDRNPPTAEEAPGARVTRPHRTPPKVTRG